jgi:NAD+ synthase
MNGFVVGVSGGVDSAVTSVLAARTGLELHLAELPIHQHTSQVLRAQQHMEALASTYQHIETHSIDLTTAFTSLINVLPTGKDEALNELCAANARSRLRMIALYNLAGQYRCLVAGTGNKIEDFGVGFFTKYGDGGVDISPIADLNKTQVYALAEYLGVNEDILSAPPTDGLFGDSRTDEQQIGASYPELEWAMEWAECQSDESNLSPRQKEVWAIYKRMHIANRHKMEPIPTCKIPALLK